MKLAARNPDRRRATVCLLWAACTATLAAGDIEVTGLDGRTTRGRLIQVTPQIVLETPQGEALFPWSELLGVRPLHDSAPKPDKTSAGPLRFDLADGSTFSGRVSAASDLGFVVEFRGDQTCRLELSMLRSIVAKSASPAAQRALAQALAEKRRTGDVAVVARGTKLMTLRGSVRRVGPEQTVFTWNQREVPLPWDRISGIVFARPTPRGASARVCLFGGDVFAGRIVAGSTASITLRSAAFEDLSLPWAQIERIECVSERLVFLSDLTPAHYEIEPLFDKHWSYARDRTLTGRPIRLGGRVYAKGLVMHSRSVLAYRLGGRFARFATTAGIVDEMESRGVVTLRVLGDGKLLWEAKGVRGGQKPHELLLDVTGVDELALFVEYDEQLDLSDHACWAYARLIR